MEIEYSPSAYDDVMQWIKSGDWNTLDRLVAIVESIKADYKSGIGKPEPLRGALSGYWSRRIDRKNRIVYKVYWESQTIMVVSLRGHYSDK